MSGIFAGVNFRTLTLFLLLFAGLTALLQWGFSIKPKNNPAAISSPLSEGFNPILYEQEVRLRLDGNDQISFQNLENRLAGAQTFEEKLPVLKEFAEFCALDLKNLWLSATYLEQIAELDNQDSSWVNAGRAYYSAISGGTPDSSFFNVSVNKAISCYEKAIELNPENKDYKVELALVFMDGSKEVMKGVPLLLSIVQEDSNHIQANLILARFGLVSGQVDKAISRLERVVVNSPGLPEGYFFLAEAYQQAGRLEEAVQMLKICRGLVEDPAFKAEIDRYIRTINSNKEN